jgi:excinuclease ABC subunit C
MFLEGKNQEVINELVKQMEAASETMSYETAARYRDQIASLRRVQEKQFVSSETGEVDVIACHVEGGLACVQVFFIRGGRNLGNKSFYPKHTDEAEPQAVLAAFLPQFYLQSKGRARVIPAEILVNTPINEYELLEKVLSEESGRRTSITSKVRGDRARWIKMAENNASIALNAFLSSKANMLHRFEVLQDTLGMDSMPTRLECFDISHTGGESTVASCVVFDQEGPAKSDYRRFNIEDITPGDDYAAMEQALNRRYTRLKQGEGRLPDILFIDGGKGQIGKAEQVLEELQVSGVQVIGVAKGPDRKPGQETLFLPHQKTPFILEQDSPALHLIQQIRDEAHRFAISAHRNKRAKARRTSVLEEIPGLGPKRRQLLLKQFGGFQEVRRAGVEDLASLPGISVQLAQRIYDALHDE